MVHYVKLKMHDLFAHSREEQATKQRIRVII